jgi:hypothetical protein
MLARLPRQRQRRPTLTTPHTNQHDPCKRRPLGVVSVAINAYDECLLLLSYCGQRIITRTTQLVIQLLRIQGLEQNSLLELRSHGIRTSDLFVCAALTSLGTRTRHPLKLRSQSIRISGPLTLVTLASPA